MSICASHYAAELNELKEDDKPGAGRFKPLQLDFKACMFVAMAPEAAAKVQPSDLVHELLTRTRDTGRGLHSSTFQLNLGRI